MNNDKRAKQLAQLETMHKRTEERLEKQRQRIDERFARAWQRIMASESNPSEDQQRIIAAALELLDEVGLNELSLRKLAAKLNLKAPALYWHFKNKESLMSYMAEGILTKEFATLEVRAADESWQDWLIDISKRFRKAMLAYRDGGRVVAGAHLFPAVTLMRLIEVSIESLTNAGMSIRQANLVTLTTMRFVSGNVIEQQATPTLQEIEQLDLAELSQKFPLVAKSIKEMLEDAKNGSDYFEESLRLIVNGLK